VLYSYVRIGLAWVCIGGFLASIVLYFFFNSQTLNRPDDNYINPMTALIKGIPNFPLKKKEKIRYLFVILLFFGSFFGLYLLSLLPKG
jgi:hypothetical protein